MMRTSTVSKGVHTLFAAGAIALAASPVFAGSPEAVAPVDDILVTEPPVAGFVNDGDQTVVETLYVYMDGCPLLSITPPENGVGQPTITMIEPDGECATAVGLADTSALVIPEHMIGKGGLHVQLWQDGESGVETVAADPQPGNSLILELSSLYPKGDGNTPGSSEDDRPVYALGTAPTFWIPGVFGNPSGSLDVASPDKPTNVVFGTGPVPGPTFSGGSNGGGGGGGSDPVTLASTPIFPNPGESPNPGPGTPSGGNGPNIAPVPLPATLLLMLWALQLMRSYVRRR